MKQVIIRGYYGRDNLGDELMKDIFINYLKDKDTNVLIMNSNPEALYKEYKIKTPNELVTGKIPSLRLAVKRFITIIRTDLFVFGGGTILTDKHGFFHLLENTCYFMVRKIFRKKSLLISVGATEFKTLIGKVLCRCIVSFSSGAYVRDTDSYKLLKKITNNSKKLVQASDMVLLSNNLLIRETPFSNVIGICIMPYNYATYHTNGNDEKILEYISSQILKINSMMIGLKFVIIPIQYGHNDTTDYDYSLKLYNKVKDLIDVEFFEEKDIPRKVDIINKCEAIISMRLHALMLAALSGRKVFAVDHNEKINYFMKRYSDIKYSVKLDELEQLSGLFIEMINEPPRIKEAILSKDYKVALKNIKAIQRTLREV